MSIIAEVVVKDDALPVGRVAGACGIDRKGICVDKVCVINRPRSDVRRYCSIALEVDHKVLIWFVKL